MLISYNWLQSFFNEPLLEAQELADRLVFRGFEVEEVRKYGHNQGIVVGQIQEIVKHPDADRLSVCQVSDGNAVHSIVCGATNIAVGQKVPLAKVGAQLLSTPDGKPFKILERKLKGIASSGMICAEDELGLGDDHAGILILDTSLPLGADFVELFDLNDYIFHLAITPNRGDALSHLGVAREVAGICNLPVPTLDTLPDLAINGFAQNNLDEVTAPATDSANSLQVKVEDEALQSCPYFTAQDVVFSKRPQYRGYNLLMSRINRCGHKLILPMVDLTHYIMLEIGQPMHAFDRQKLAGNLGVRFAKPNEKIKLLNELEVDVNEQCLLVTTADKACALAGIMGGFDSANNEETCEVTLEAAHFVPSIIRGKSRFFQLTSDAAFRFERGVDPRLPKIAQQRASKLIGAWLADGVLSVGKVQEFGAPPAVAERIEINYSKLLSVLGIDIQPQQVLAKLSAIGFAPELAVADDGQEIISIDCPYHRFDLSIAEDIAEEVIRTIGYENLQSSLPETKLNTQPISRSSFSAEKLRENLATLGYSEIISYAFGDIKRHQTYSNLPVISLANPISAKLNAMRTNLLGDIVATAAFNQSQQAERISLFEIGRCYFYSDLANAQITERDSLSMLRMGPRYARHHGDNPTADYYDLLADLKRILYKYGANTDWEVIACDNLQDSTAKIDVQPAFHPLQSAYIMHADVVLGMIGSLHPELVHAEQLETTQVSLLQIDLGKLEKIISQNQITFASYSRLPMVYKDISMSVRADISAAQVISEAKQCAKNYENVRDIDLFDVYQSTQMATSGQKNVGLHISMQGKEQNLTEQQIAKQIDALMVSLRERLE